MSRTARIVLCTTLLCRGGTITNTSTTAVCAREENTMSVKQSNLFSRGKERICLRGDSLLDNDEHLHVSSPSNSLSVSSNEVEEEEKEKQKPLLSFASLSSSSMKGCQLYLAESSIPNAGLGLYTSIDLPSSSSNSSNIIGPPDIILPILDLELHNDYVNNGVNSFIRDYSWTATKIPRVKEEAKRVTVISPGMGMLSNSHLGLVNIEMDTRYISSYMDYGGLHRNVDPGVGAFSAYYNLQHRVKGGGGGRKTIQAGSELFHDYGTRWFRRREDRLGLVPFGRNYREADAIVRAMVEFIETFSLTVEDDCADHVWHLIRDIEMTTEDKIHNFTETYRGINITLTSDGIRLLEQTYTSNTRTLAALPNDVSALRHAATVGTARYSVPNFVRSIDWLEHNGLCVDNLTPGPSTVPEAGRGAFATRFIPRGTVIAPAPLIHIPNRTVLDMYVFDWYHPGSQRKVSYGQKLNRQLLLNYCFGYRKSTLLLFPYSPVVNFINHDGTSPNAALRWSKSTHHQREWLERTVDDLKQEERPGLMLEYVAIRDIRPGEEVFINYGVDWERAWKRHVKEWSPPPGAREYVSASEMNSNRLDIPTAEEGNSTQYPGNIQVACYYDFRFESDELTSNNNKRDASEHMHENPAEEAISWKMKDDLFQGDIYLHPCQILSKVQTDSGHPKYLGVILERNSGGSLKLLVKDIPREAVVFLDRAYTTDVHLSQAFRHEIFLPDDMFPSAWMNL